MKIILGYDLYQWNDWNIKEPILLDISLTANKHILLSGKSGSGKSYAEQQIFARLAKNNPDMEAYFADYKQEDAFEYLRGCSRYFGYKKSIEALEIVYERLQQRQSRQDQSRNLVVLVWDEYVANVLSLQNSDKKLASVVMGRISEILMLGRSLNIAFFCSCQRPDALVFPYGARLNYGAVVVLGKFNRSIYEMLMPDDIDIAKNEVFGKGEGMVSVGDEESRFIKFPKIQNEKEMQELCIKALS